MGVLPKELQSARFHVEFGAISSKWGFSKSGTKIYEKKYLKCPSSIHLAIQCLYCEVLVRHPTVEPLSSFSVVSIEKVAHQLNSFY